MLSNSNETEVGQSSYVIGCNISTDYWNNTSNSTTAHPDYEKHFGMYFHPHWQKNVNLIESASYALVFGFGVFITAVCLVGVIGNATVVYIFSRTVGLRTPSNLLVINLAVSDLAFACICGFPLMSLASFDRHWRWGNTSCKWYGFIAAVCGLNSINSLTCISIDRYWAISRPLKMLHDATKTRSIKMIACSWAWALVWSVPPMLGWSDYIGEGFQVSCTFDYLTLTTANIVYNNLLVVFEFVIPVALIVISYAGIIFSVSRHTSDLNVDQKGSAARSASVKGHQQQDKHFDQELKLAKIAAIMVTLFVLSWLPYTIVSQLGINGHQEFITPYVAQFPVLLAKSSAVWNPIVYSLTHPCYQSAIADRLPEPLKTMFCRKVLLKTTMTGSKRFTSTTSQSGRRKRDNQASDSDVIDHSLEKNVSTPCTPNAELVLSIQISTIQLTTTAL